MKPKIAFFDLEGTLLKIPLFESQTDVPVSMWTVLAQLLGEECYKEEELSKIHWERSAGQYMAWMDESVRIFIRYGLRRHHLESLIAMVELYPGVQSTMNRLHSWGTKIAIITGGLKAVAENVQISVHAQHLFAGCELYFNSEGEVLHWNLLPTDYKAKVDFMRLLISEYGFSPSECVFVGDGKNDIHLAQEVGLSIAFNGHSSLRMVSSVSVDGNDFSVIGDIVADHIPKQFVVS